MNHEQAFFFQVLRDYLNRQTTELPADVDVGKVCIWAEAHKLGGIFFAQCGSTLAQSPAVFARLQKDFGAAVYHSTVRNDSYAKLQAAFRQAGIPFIPVKGVLIAPVYPDPQLRTMGDMDLLVRYDDRERIRDVLTPLGFTNTKWSEVEWDYRQDMVEYELQINLIKPGGFHNPELEGWLNDYWPQAEADGSGGYRLNASFHFFYLITHIAKHIRWVGVGFRQFYDLSILMRYSSEAYDWAWIREQAERLGFFRFVQICLALNERWFGVPSPYPTDELTDNLFETVTNKIFGDGVFGFDNANNYLQHLATGQSDGSSTKVNRWRSIRKLLFPPYRDLITSQKYAWLRGKPLLLPAAWVLRAVRGRNKQSRRQAAASYLKGSDAEIAARIVILKELGL